MLKTDALADTPITKASWREMPEKERLTFINKILRENSVGNLFHVFTFKSSVLFSLSLTLVRKKKNIHAISSITGLGYFFGNTTIARLARTIFRLPLRTILSGTYDYYIFQNKTDLNRLKSYLKLNPKNLKLIESSGLETKKIKIKKNFTTENLKVIMATRLLKEKGIDEYIEIAKKVKEQNKKIDFFLAGEIDKGNPSSIDEEQLVEIINDDDIIYLGNVDDLQNKLLEYDIAVTTSYHEGFSRFLLESSYVGLYCLSNYLPGTEAILKNNLNGKLINNNNIDEFVVEIINYATKDTIDEGAILEQRRFINKEFSIEKVTQEFVDIYSKIEIDV